MKIFLLSLAIGVALAASASAQSVFYPFAANHIRKVNIGNYALGSVTSVGQASHGSVVLSDDGELTYRLDSTFSGYDTFPYEYIDGEGNSISGIFSIADIALARGNYMVVVVEAGGSIDGEDDYDTADLSAIPEDPEFPITGGMVTVTATGAFTFRNGLTSASGQFKLPDGSFDAGLGGPDFPPFYTDLSLNLSLENGTPVITGTYLSGSLRVYSAFRTFVATKITPSGRDAGRYSVLMQTSPGYGTGWATMTVAPGGLISYSGQLNDGRAFSARAAYSANRTFSVNVSNRLAGSATFRDRAGISDFDGEAIFAGNNGSTPVNFIGSRFVPAGAGQHLLKYSKPTGKAILNFSGGTLDTAENGSANFAPGERVEGVKGPVKALSVWAYDSSVFGAVGGIFAGEFVGKGIGTRSFKGVYFQKQNIAAGLFRTTSFGHGDDSYGTVTLTPQ